MSLYMTADIGGTSVKLGVVDEKGEILARDALPNPIRQKGVDAMLGAVAEKIRACRGRYDFAGLAVSTAGVVGENGVVLFAGPNFPGYGGTPLAERLGELCGLPCTAANDANCAALGEAVAGCGQGVKNFVMITLGTGVGSGLIVNGKLVTGLNYAAGEMGHTVIVFNGLQCNCGRRGCWEKYSSATALISQTKDAMRLDPYSLMWDEVGGDYTRVSGRTAFRAADKGDVTAKKVVSRYISYLACGVSNLINIFQPEILCVGGGIGNEKENLLAPLRKIVASEIYSIHAKKQTKIMSATLGNDAGIIGAAALFE